MTFFEPINLFAGENMLLEKIRERESVKVQSTLILWFIVKQALRINVRQN